MRTRQRILQTNLNRFKMGLHLLNKTVDEEKAQIAIVSEPNKYTTNKNPFITNIILFVNYAIAYEMHKNFKRAYTDYLDMMKTSFLFFYKKFNHVIYTNRHRADISRSKNNIIPQVDSSKPTEFN